MESFHINYRTGDLEKALCVIKNVMGLDTTGMVISTIEISKSKLYSSEREVFEIGISGIGDGKFLEIATIIEKSKGKNTGSWGSGE